LPGGESEEINLSQVRPWQYRSFYGGKGNNDDAQQDRQDPDDLDRKERFTKGKIATEEGHRTLGHRDQGHADNE
jgi:hypothetical protein